MDTAAVLAMAARWDASTGELRNAVAPAGLGLSCQTSAAAVDAAHGEVAAFTAGLAARVHGRANGVTQVDATYLAQEADSTSVLAAVLPSVVSE